MFWAMYGLRLATSTQFRFTATTAVSLAVPPPTAGTGNKELLASINRWLYHWLAGWQKRPSRRLSKEHSSTWIKAHVYIAGGGGFNTPEKEYLVGLSCALVGSISDGEVTSMLKLIDKQHNLNDGLEERKGAQWTTEYSSVLSQEKGELMDALNRMRKDPFCQKADIPRLLVYLGICAAAGDGYYSSDEKERCREVASALGLNEIFVSEAEAIAQAERNIQQMRQKLLGESVWGLMFGKGGPGTVKKEAAAPPPPPPKAQGKVARQGR